MELMEVKNNWVVRNLLGAVAAVAGIIIIAALGLRIGTRHGKEIEVPDFTGMLYEEAVPVAKDAGVKVVVADSVYQRAMRRNAVYNQTPKPGEMVKRGRKIELTTNSRQAKKIAMPSLVGLSTQQAKTELATKGLVLGKLIYVRDIATNNVMKQQYRGRDIKPGSMIFAGSTINLVVGLSSLDNKTYVPKLIGKNHNRAVELIHDGYLNVGKVSYDSSVKNYNDSIRAVVCAQSPEFGRRPYVMGTEVSFTLSVDPEKIKSK